MAQVALFEKPKIFVVYIFISLFLFLINYAFFNDSKQFFVSALVILIMSIGGLGINYAFKGRLKINGKRKNTLEAMFIGAVGVVIVLIVSSVVALSLGLLTNITTLNSLYERFVTANSIAMIGALPQFFLTNQTFLTGLILIVLIAPIETIVSIDIGDAMLHSLKSTYKLNDPKVWVVGVLIGIGAIFYHIYAKFIIVTQSLNIHALIVVASLFTIGVLLAVRSKEQEPAIWMHIENNALAFLPFL